MSMESNNEADNDMNNDVAYEPGDDLDLDLVIVPSKIEADNGKKSKDKIEVCT